MKYETMNEKKNRTILVLDFSLLRSTEVNYRTKCTYLRHKEKENERSISLR